MSACVKGFLVLVLVLGWTQCLPQHGWFPQNTGGGGSPGRRDRWVQFAQPPSDCGAPTTFRMYPVGAILCYRFQQLSQRNPIHKAKQHISITKHAFIVIDLLQIMFQLNMHIRIYSCKQGIERFHTVKCLTFF